LSLFGTTGGGGAGGGGTVYSVSGSVTGGPFRFVQSAGKVGQTVEILGQGLTSKTQVYFVSPLVGGVVEAKFKAISDTYLTATVPNGSEADAVTVQTASGQLTSNVPFLVEPQISSITPTIGPAGTAVIIAGKCLTQTSAVSFNSVKATSFYVESDGYVTTNVRPGC